MRRDAEAIEVGTALKRMLPFNKALADQTGGQRKILRRDYLREGFLPVIDQGAELVAGYTNDERAAYTGTLPVLLFGDHTRLVKYVDFPFALGADGVKALSPKPWYEPKFLYYYLSTLHIPSRGYSRHFKFLRRFAFPFVPVSEQRRIVEILDQADRLRRLRAEADAKADRILPGLFIKMFGDPATNPMGWPSSPLGELARHITSGSRGWAAYTGKGTAFFVRTQDVRDGEISKDLVSLDPPARAESERTRLLEGDVVVTITGMVGKAAVVRDSCDDLYVSQHVALIRPRLERILPEYLAAYANLPLGQVPVLARFQYGQTKPGLGFRELRTARIPLPPVHLQESFSKRVSALRSTRNAMRQSQPVLESLWSHMLDRAFSGSLTTTWREAHMKELLQEMEQQAKTLAEA